MELLSQRARLHIQANGHSRWLQQAEQTAQQNLQTQQLELIKPLTGGVGSIVLLTQDPQGNKRVAKLMPPQEQQHQAAALKTMQGQAAPQLIKTTKQMLIIEYIEGQDKPQNITLKQAEQLLQQWDKPAPAEINPLNLQLHAWLKAATPAKNTNPAIHQAVSWAQHQLNKMPSGNQLLHGDTGQHNLIQNHQLYLIDPTGAAGPKEADIAFLSFLWPGHPETQTVKTILHELCHKLDADPDLATQYAKIRAACSAGFGNNRGDQAFSQRALKIFSEL